MSYEDGIGYKRVKIVTDSTGKDFIRVKQVSDLTVKNYVNVKESTDKCVDVVVVTSDEPKNYLLVNFIGSVEKTNRATFDGTNLVKVPILALGVGDFISMKFSNFVASASYRRFTASPDYAVGVDTGADSTKFRLLGCTATLDGVAIVSDSTVIPSDSLEHELVITLTIASSLIESIGGIYGIADKEITADIWDANFNDQAFYPINDGWANNPTIADSLGGEDATAISFTELLWKEV